MKTKLHLLLSLLLPLALMGLSPVPVHACPFNSPCRLYANPCFSDVDCVRCPQKISVSIYICGPNGGIVEYCTGSCCICA